MKHQPEPWTTKDVLLVDAKGMEVKLSMNPKHEQAYANARRLFACVNACERISTHHLKDRGVIIRPTCDTNCDHTNEYCLCSRTFIGIDENGCSEYTYKEDS
jgi:hypothetical protein